MALFLKHGRTLFAIAIIAFGMEHVICAQWKTAVIPVIPWVPAAPFFAYLTGIGLLLAGVNLALNWRAHLSAVWSGIFFLVSVVLLQLPRLLAAPLNLGIRTETFETLALCGASFMLAGTLSAEKHYLLPWQNAEDAAIRGGRFLFAGSVGESVQVMGDVNRSGNTIDASRIGKGTGTCPATGPSGQQPPPKQ